jgi:hypothetical protein
VPKAGGQAMGGMGTWVRWVGRPQAVNASRPALTPVEESNKGWVGGEKEADSPAFGEANSEREWRGTRNACHPPPCLGPQKLLPSLSRWLSISKKLPWEFMAGAGAFGCAAEGAAFAFGRSPGKNCVLPFKLFRSSWKK